MNETDRCRDYNTEAAKRSGISHDYITPGSPQKNNGKILGFRSDAEKASSDSEYCVNQDLQSKKKSTVSV